MGSATSWFQFSLTSQVTFYLLSLVNPYLSASINIPNLLDVFSGGFFNAVSVLWDTIKLISGSILGATNIGFINQYILPIMITINIVMGLILLTPTQN